MANTTADNWDETSPSLTQARRSGAGEILSLREGVNQRISKEHEALAPETGSSPSISGGEHLQGSAKVFVGTVAPTLRPDGITLLDTNDAGRLWDFSSSGRLKIWNGSSWIENNYPSSTSFAQANANPYNIPFTKGSLGAGTWLVHVYGSNGVAGTVSLTVNGVVTTVVIEKGMFTIPTLVVVTGAGTISVTALSAPGAASVQGMVAVRTAW